MTVVAAFCAALGAAVVLAPHDVAGRRISAPSPSSPAIPGWCRWGVPALGVAVVPAVQADAVQLAVLLLAGGASAATGWRLVLAGRLRKARRSSQRAVMELCDALGAELRAGLPASVAIERACGDTAEWSPLVAAGRLGGDVVAAARACAARPGAEGMRAVAAAWEVGAHSGATLAGVLDRVAAGLRVDDDARAEVLACLGPARATAKMLAVLPVFGLLLGVSMDAHPVGFLLGTAPGAACLGLGVVLALTGVLWVERIAAGAEV
jgi:tight adherence protein B